MSKSYQITNQVFSAVSHGIGLVLAIIGLVFLLIKAITNQSYPEFIAYSVYGISMCILYFNSTLYHSLSFTHVRPIFQFFDHTSIYLLIAGSYAPYCLLAVSGWLGWSLFIAEWLLAGIGIIGKAMNIAWIHRFEVGLYLLMGWLAVFAIKPILDSVPLPGLIWLLVGGILYSIGTYFYANDKKFAFFHFFWHLFVMLGTACLFISIFVYL